MTQKPPTFLGTLRSVFEKTVLMSMTPDMDLCIITPPGYLTTKVLAVFTPRDLGAHLAAVDEVNRRILDLEAEVARLKRSAGEPA